MFKGQDASPLWFGGEGNDPEFSCYTQLLGRPDFLLVVRGYIGFLLLCVGGEGGFDDLAIVRVGWPCVGASGKDQA